MHFKKDLHLRLTYYYSKCESFLEKTSPASFSKRTSEKEPGQVHHGRVVFICFSCFSAGSCSEDIPHRTGGEVESFGQVFYELRFFDFLGFL